MRICRLSIQNFRRIVDADIFFEPAAFLVGPNNTGKSSVIAALEALFSLESEKLTQNDIHEREDGTRAEQTVITGYIHEIPGDVAASRGFRGRVINGEFIYRKTLISTSNKPIIETKEYPFTPKPEFGNAKSIGDLIAAGLDEEEIQEAFNTTDQEFKLKKGWERSVPSALNFDIEAEPTWVQNPGGIPQNVLSRLPRLIHVPAITNTKDIDSSEKRYILGECLSLLFEDLIQGNPVATTIQQNLETLEQQMNPTDENSLISVLLADVNKIICEVFPQCGISIEPSLQGLVEVLKPKYNISLFSNIKTEASKQGTGLIRTCIFAMLRHHSKLKLQKDLQTRPILVAFEEPEQYLHPSVANMLRDTIYSLGQSDQIICSTHSPWMIDLSKDLQSLTRLYLLDGVSASAVNYGISSKLVGLPEDDKQRIKMLQVFDDELSRVFFADEVIVVEGDSEVLAIRETLKLLPPEIQKIIQSRFQIAKARGKASIVSLIKYLKALNILPRVMHDGDVSVAGAEKFNGPIFDALNAPDRLVFLNNNLEETLGYLPPNSDKPFRAYRYVKNWTNAAEVPVNWRNSICRLFDIVWPE
jgi:putative ATP-dependent endonuclease of the OLD family